MNSAEFVIRCGLPHRKMRFPSQPDAERVAKKRLAEARIDLRIYRCPTCLGWHLTKRVLPTTTKENTQ